MNIDLRNQVIVLVLAACLFIPFLGRVHLFDWDEINFAEASREMMVSGNYLQVQIDFKPFWEKPPLFFWLQTLSMHVFGVNEFGARLVNALCGLFTVLVVYRIGRKFFDSVMGMLWSMAFLGSFLPHFFFKSGIIDPVFNLFIFSGVYFLACAVDAPIGKKRLVRFLLSGVCVGLAVLAKGPVAFLIVALCVACYWICTRFKTRPTLREMLMMAGAVAVVSGLWYGLETLWHGTWFITEFAKYQIRLLSTGDAGHGRPFYFHFLVLLFGCFPASFLAIRSFFIAKSGTARQQDFTRWMIVLFWVVLVLFSIVKTKTVLYSSLCYFPITYLAAFHMHSVVMGKCGWNKALTFALAAFGGLVALIIAAFPIVMMHKEMITPLIKDRFAVACLQRPIHWSYFESSIGAAYAAVLAISVAFLARKKVKNPTASCEASSIPMEGESYSRLLTPKHHDYACLQAYRSSRASEPSGNAQTLGFKAAFIILFLSSALCLQLFMLDMVPKMERIAGGGPIDFYQGLKGRDCYACSLFKTYADLFYFEKKPGGNSLGHDRDWLLSGPIDKPAYFVCRIDKAHEYRGKYDLHEIKDEYGFVYFRRDPTIAGH
jgi:4-amino-4-deoxy-L-arabinose transferase-like glycosyltransferase